MIHSSKFQQKISEGLIGEISAFYELLLNIFTGNDGDLLKGKDSGHTIDGIAKKLGYEVKHTAASREQLSYLQTRIGQFKKFCEHHLGEMFGSIKFEHEEKALYFFAKTAEEYLMMFEKTKKRKEKIDRQLNRQQKLLAEKLSSSTNKEDRKLFIAAMK